ncbi:MAG: radical SAM protein [Deltaproteobacteria bacterium]|nr:radical SAM protein [Deltaproteobacteria bacterium]
MGLLYTPMKVFRYREKIDSLPRERAEITAPVHVRIKPTNACNHDCWYCAYRVDNLQLGQDMSVRDRIPREKMIEIIEDLVEIGVKAVTFSGGGEPFAYRHIAEAARRLADSPISFASLTNAAKLQGEAAEIFAHHGSWVRVSIDGYDAESYAKYRNVKIEEFDRVLSNIAAFKRYGGPCRLGISFIIDQRNADHVFSFVSRMKDLGVDSVKLSPCIVSNDGRENNAYHQPIFERVKEQARRAQADLNDDGFEVYDSYHALDEKFSKSYHWCPYLQILPIIGADLNVYACQDKAYNLETGVLGSIVDRRFRDFWFSDKNKFFAIDPARDCDHHCVANQKNKLLLSYLEADADHAPFV